MNAFPVTGPAYWAYQDGYLVRTRGPDPNNYNWIFVDTTGTVFVQDGKIMRFQRDNELKINDNKSCTCGTDKAGGGIHSSWCDKE